jgi:hypothetical protein
MRYIHRERLFLEEGKEVSSEQSMVNDCGVVSGSDAFRSIFVMPNDYEDF